MQAFQFLGLEALADNKLGAAAADINHQPFTGIVCQGVRYPQIDQAGFFPAGNYFHRITQDVLRPGNKLVGVACHPQGVGADNLHPRRRHALKPLGKPAQALQRPLLGGLGQAVVLVQASAELNLLAHFFHRADLAVYEAGHDHVKTVGAHINGCQHVRCGCCVLGVGGGRHVGRNPVWCELGRTISEETGVCQ